MIDQSTIRISKTVRNKLARLGKKCQTYDDLIAELVNHAQTCDRFVVDRN